VTDDPTALAGQAAAREALIEQLAEGHWRLDWPNQGYPWSEENRPTADAHRRGAGRCLDAIALAGLRLVPANTDPTAVEQAAAWMHEAQRQAVERDRNYELLVEARQDIERLTAERDAARAEVERQIEAHGRTVDRELADGWNRVADLMEAGQWPPAGTEQTPQWAVRHPGIGVLTYDTEADARVAAGTAGTVLVRDGDEWREADGG
jgi:hypothetical protein